MISFAHTNVSNTTEFLKHAVRTLEYYGFVPFEEAPKGVSVQLKPSQKINTKHFNFMHKEERALVPVVHTCAARGLGRREMPVFLWRHGARHGSGSSRYATLELHAVGVPSAVAEALLITVASAIAEDIGLAKRIVYVNSIGTPDSSARFAREVGNYLRKHTDALGEQLTARVPHDPLGVLAQLAARGNPVVDRAPQSMEFLNEEERAHLWSLLEYLETAQVEYELNPYVLGSRDCWMHTLFEVGGVDHETGTISSFARGGRYDALAQNACGSGACAAGLSLSYELKGAGADRPVARAKNARASIYFAYLGPEARRGSLPVLEQLRQARIPVYQSLAVEQLGDQMREASRLGVPYLVIMGYKEVMDGTVLVRDTRTNAQTPVSINELIGYLKRRRVHTFA